MSETHSVTHLIDQIRAGNQGQMAAAAVDLWNRYFPELLRIAARQLGGAVRRRVHDEDVANDACNTFLRRQALGQFDLANRDELWALLVEITRNKARKAARDATADKRDVRREQPAPADDTAGLEWLAEIRDRPSPTPEEALAATEQLEQLLAVLDPKLRQVAELKLDGLTHEEIAARLGCVVRTVERHVDRIREKWQEHGYGPNT